jgi:hypothetical protein
LGDLIITNDIRVIEVHSSGIQLSIKISNRGVQLVDLVEKEVI